MDKRVGSQIPPLASLGRDDKRGKMARSIDKRGRRAAEGVGPYGRDDKRGKRWRQERGAAKAAPLIHLT